MGLLREINNIELLKKAVQILSCVIYGHSIRALLRHDTKFFIEQTGADLLVLCVRKNEGSRVDFFPSKQRLFSQLLKKYNCSRHGLLFDVMGEKILEKFSSAQPYLEFSDLYDFMKGSLSKVKYDEMMQEARFARVFFFPIQLANRKKIGFIAYFFTQKKATDMEKLKDVSALIQRVIEPLYDAKTATFYSKCAQIDSDMSRLTSKEKEIVHRVIRGSSYKEIAHELNISINTLKTHIKNVFSKYGVDSKVKLINKLSIHVR